MLGGDTLLTGYLLHVLMNTMASRRVFVVNLPFDLDEKKIRSHFEGAGKVVAVEMVQDPENASSHGMAFVTFVDATAAAKAIERFDKTLLKGRFIVVSLADK